MPPILPPFPGRVLELGSTDAAAVLAIQKRLNQIGCGPVTEDKVYGAQTLEAVELFQARSADAHGAPLSVDGRVGPMTWAALFGAATVAAISEPASALACEVLRIATAEIGVLEAPPGSNRGPRVDQYLKSVKLNPAKGSYAWCAAFVFWCFREASKSLAIDNPAVQTAGALDTWNQAGVRGIVRLSSREAVDMPSLVQPGMVFVLGTSGGQGHVGIVKQIDGVILTTIEGNTNDGGSREGVGVFL
ncbi:MAG: CHAP domain-containing protein, partial [Acidobacteria bacterium]|nr:CHAP domain-containing protein [Acidobacteriota bacterium]